ncbi:DUF1566 domain-containing protein, partial [Leptospira interrogans serovar Pomona]|nr:DUF1566 domain-containing protein [Leptospira interrogans serovar Pomona]
MCFLFFLFFCAKLPNKPDPPYVIFQYLQKLNSNNTEQEQTNNSANGSQCQNGPTNFNPGAVFDTGQTTCWDNLGTVVTCLGTGND